MKFNSILFPTPVEPSRVEPDFFVDLNLDQVVAAVTSSKQEYDLAAFFHTPLHSIDAIMWRQAIMQDVDRGEIFDALKSFEGAMRTVREHDAQIEKLHYDLQKQRWLLDAIALYCDAVARLTSDLAKAPIRSQALLGFRQALESYTSSEPFTALSAETKGLIAELEAIHYGAVIKGLTVQVRKFGGEPDYGSAVEKTFAKFRQSAAKEYRFHFGDSADMNHVEAKILDCVAQLYSDVFARLDRHCQLNAEYRHPSIIAFDREIQFYIAYLEHIGTLRRAALQFCYPRMSNASKELYSERAFDLPLASKLVGTREVVCNDFYLAGEERAIVVSGPNQGGKTTFARMFGQLHYLASLGCPVPGVRAQLFLFDHILTHFEREENVKTLRGKLQDDLIRLHGLLERATPDSIIILNEIFTSTALRDAVMLSRRIAGRVLELDALCVWVTFIDELASLSEKTVSMTSTVVPENPAQRTFRIVRRPADGLAYAMSIAEKHRVTHRLIRERVGS